MKPFAAIIISMEKTKLAIATDEIIRAVAIWLMSAIIIRYFIKELYLIILIATAITMLITMLIRIYYGKKNLTKEKQKRTNDVLRELMTISRDDLLLRLSEATGGNAVNDAVLTAGTVIYPYFYGKLPLEKLNHAYNLALTEHKKLLIICSEISTDVEKNVEMFSETPLAILTKNKAYEFLDKYKLLPEVKCRSKKKIKIFKAALRKTKIKGYLLTAIVLLFTAAFSPYAILCIIAAAVNITMSILCEVKGY